MEIKRCFYDNPNNFRREFYENGFIYKWISLDGIEVFMTACPKEECIQWKSGQIVGDKDAMINNCIKVVVIKDMAEGNETVGEMWQETKIFNSTEQIQNILDWAFKNCNLKTGSKRKITITVPDESVLG